MNKNVMKNAGSEMDGARREENECRNKTRKFLEKFFSRERAGDVCVYIEKEVPMQIAVSIIFEDK